MGIDSHITGSLKLTEIFGCWPTFHDAEIIDLQLWCGGLDRKVLGEWSSMLLVKIHIFIEHPTSHHTLATLRFEEVDDFQMKGFNYQNAIYGLIIELKKCGDFTNGEDLPNNLDVRFDGAFGMSASFRCSRIEVVDAVRCSETGEPCLKLDH